MNEGREAWLRLALSVVVGTITCVGNWSVIVALPTIQVEFDTLRSGASLPYTFAMIGFAAGSIGMGRIVDRFSLMVPLLIGAFLIGSGYIAASMTTSIYHFALVYGVLIGPGTAAGFSPLIADISHWFHKRRGLAVAIAASGSYLAGVLWPPIIEHMMASSGWRMMHVYVGCSAFVALVPLAFALRARPAVSTAGTLQKDVAESAGPAMRRSHVQLLMAVAGFACCMAMAMPQVHLVAYCGDLGYGVATGTKLLSMTLGLGVVSRIASGMIADKIGGGRMLLIGSAMQAASLLIYAFSSSLTSLYLVSGMFGLFQGGIVPMYAVLVREYFPGQEAGTRIATVMTATMIGMAAGGVSSGLIYDLTGSYEFAFLHGFGWNLVNLALVGWLVFDSRRLRSLKPRNVELHG